MCFNNLAQESKLKPRTHSKWHLKAILILISKCCRWWGPLTPATHVCHCVDIYLRMRSHFSHFLPILILLMTKHGKHSCRPSSHIWWRFLILQASGALWCWNFFGWLIWPCVRLFLSGTGPTGIRESLLRVILCRVGWRNWTYLTRSCVTSIFQ